MPAVSPAEVAALAHLARLELTDDACATLAPELTAILDHVAQLASVDVTGIEPMTHAVVTTGGLRDDVARPPLAIADALGGAAATRDGYFEVPAVIE